MIQGEGQRDLLTRSWQIGLWDDVSGQAITMSFTTHQMATSMDPLPLTRISYKEEGILYALANALQNMGILPESATSAELKATKYHLEDVRKLSKLGGVK